MKFAPKDVGSFDGFRTSLSGGHRRGATPVPIPNTEVKPSTGDGTNGAIRWESSKLPGFILKDPSLFIRFGSFYLRFPQ